MYNVITMKKILLTLIILFVTSCSGICGQMQNRYERLNTFDYNIINRLHCNNLYEVVIAIYNNSDEAGWEAIKTIRRNFENNPKIWERVTIDDYTYKFLDDDTRQIILLNNAICKRQRSIYR